MSHQEAQENGNGGPPESAAGFNLNFKPETEDQFIEFFKWLKSREHQSVIKLHWTLGKKIEEAGETVYGQNTAGRIAEEVGYSKSTVHKSRRLARDYSAEQVALLLNGQFPISWRDITQNQSVPPEDFIRTYSESSNQDEFRNAVTELKDPDDIKRKVKPLYRRGKGTLNREYCLLMKNQIAYRDYQVNLRELEINELKKLVAELTDKLAQYENEVSKNNTTDQIDATMDQKFAARAA